MDGWRQAASLAVIALAVLAALTLTGAATADDGEQAATAPTALQPTQVVAEIPEGYNQLFPLQWGGGSLYQLKMRLATMGCIANTIWNYDSGEWHGYNQYNVPSTLNADWLSAYGEFVPAGSLFATCYDVCKFSYFEAPRGDRPCQSLAEFRERDFYNIPKYPIDDSSECTDDFDERVKEHVLPSMPLYPGVCIIRQSIPSSERAKGTAIAPVARLNAASVNAASYPYYPSIIVVYSRAVATVTEWEQVRALDTEVHELCHTNQSVHFIEQMKPDLLIAVPWGTNNVWAATTPGNTFIDLVGFTRDDDGEWSLPAGTYEGIYGHHAPTELAAEVCSMYFIHKMGERNAYAYVTYDNKKRRNEWDAKDFDPAQYLTDEIVQWIETWVALPAITGAEAD